MKKPLRNPEIILEEIDDEALLFNPVDDDLHVLNPTALTVWNKCDGSHSIEEIGKYLRETCQCPEDSDVESDVADIVSTLSGLGVLL